MNQLEDAILGFLFDKKYMDFKTCSELRSVSAKFDRHASKYFHSLKEVDLLILKNNFEWHSESIETPYTCLLETVTKYCDNMEKVTGIKVMTDKLNSVSQICLQKLPKLTSIVISDGLLKTSVLFDFLKLFPNLRSVKVGKFENVRDEDDQESDLEDDDGEPENVREENDAELEVGDMPEEEKLVVPELSLDRGDFWRMFRVDRLEKLAVSNIMIGTEEEVNAFCGVVEQCRRLEQLEVEIFADMSTLFPPLLRLAEVLPNLHKFTLNMWECSTMENVTLLAQKYPILRQCVKKLTLFDLEPKGCRWL